MNSPIRSSAKPRSMRPSMFAAALLLLPGCSILQQPRTGPEPDVYVAYVAETRIPFVVNSSVVYVVMNDRPMDPDSIIAGLKPICQRIPKNAATIEVFDSDEQYRWRAHDVKGPLSARLDVTTGSLAWNLDAPDPPLVYDAGARWCATRSFTRALSEPPAAGS